MRDLSRVIRECAVALLDQANRLEDAQSEDEFLQLADDLKEQSQRLNGIAEKVHPIRFGTD